MSNPETRASLLLRVRDASDQDAWAEFAEIYQPVIRAMAIGRGCNQPTSMIWFSR